MSNPRLEDQYEAEKRLNVAIATILSRHISDLVDACLDESGNIRAPSKRAIMKARAAIPPYLPHTLVTRSVTASATPDKDTTVSP